MTPTRLTPPLVVALAILAAGCVAPQQPLERPLQVRPDLRTTGLIASNSGRLIGKIKMPDNGLVASNGAELIANNGGTLIASNSGRYATLDAAAWVAGAGATVRVLNEQGRMLTSIATAADPSGQFSFRRISASGAAVFIEATAEREGLTLTVTAMVAAPRKGSTTVEVTPATSLVAKKLKAMFAARALNGNALDAAKLAPVVKAVTEAMDDEAAVAACVLNEAAGARYFDGWLESKPELRSAIAPLVKGHALEGLLEKTPEKVAGAPAPEAEPTPVPTPEPSPPPAPASDRGVFAVAGYGVPGYSEGPVATARFNVPYDVATDRFGNVYVADSENHSLRKISANGQVTTLAGDGSSGFANGRGRNARFRELSGVAVAANGTIYVADYANHAIRKVSPDGTVTTFAGDGTPGLADGVGAAARFRTPTDLTVDRACVLYVSDEGNHAIRKITPDGTVTTLAGNGSPGFADGVGAAAQLNMPSDVALDVAGNLYVADTENHALRKIAPDGTLTTLAGNGKPGFSDGEGAAASFNTPYGLVVDAQGTIYVADSLNDAVRQVTASGAVSTFGGAGDGTLFKLPSGLAIRKSASGQGEVFVADAYYHRVTKFNIDIPDEELIVPK